MSAVTEAVFDDPAIDMVVIGTNHLAVRQCWRDFIALAQRFQKPLGIVVSSDLPSEIVDAFRDSDGVLPDEDGYQILRKLRLLHLRARRAEQLQAPAGPDSNGADYQLARPSGQLTEAEAKALLRSRLPIPPGETVHSVEQAVEVAERLGYPVVAKLTAPGLQHKTELGALRLNLRAAEDVRQAFDALLAQARQQGLSQPSVLMETMAPAGTEVVIGFVRDSALGPVVAFGAGGVLVELLRDVVYRVAPLDEAEARAMVRQSLASRLLEGFRGEPARDVDALIRLMVEASRLFAANEWLQELEFNPVSVLPAGYGALILDVLAVTATPGGPAST
jgi:acyl-CoA synthetase (NDP forming)